MEISTPYLPLLVSAVQDALTYRKALLRSETLRNREDYEEHVLQLSEFFEYIKNEYRRVEDEVGLPLSDLVKEGSSPSG